MNEDLDLRMVTGRGFVVSIYIRNRSKAFDVVQETQEIVLAPLEVWSGDVHFQASLTPSSSK